ncbi:MAG TPA: hypothetical protein VMT20_02520 [Terriglobia bacterium]|nr:hypothetical protein [Terriglobia bacterium]
MREAIQKARAETGGVASPFGRHPNFNIENEGTSHDVIENKGPDFLSHDVHDK